jgi:hypothetical protein
MTIKPQMLWRFEVNDPLRFTDWRPLWDFPDADLVASRELRDDLNRINAPVLIRIVSTTQV